MYEEIYTSPILMSRVSITKTIKGNIYANKKTEFS